MNALIRKNADNVFAAYLQTAGSERIMELKPLKEIYALLSDKAKETAPGKILAERIADLEKVSIAATAPDFTLTTPEGKQVSVLTITKSNFEETVLKSTSQYCLISGLPGADRAAWRIPTW